jgi:hypothetical protein
MVSTHVNRITSSQSTTSRRSLTETLVPNVEYPFLTFAKEKISMGEASNTGHDFFVVTEFTARAYDHGISTHRPEARPTTIGLEVTEKE